MFFTVSAGSIHSEGSSRLKPASRCGTAVAVGSMRVTAPWKCSRRIADMVDGTVWNRVTMVSISSSDRPAVKLDSQ